MIKVFIDWAETFFKKKYGLLLSSILLNILFLVCSLAGLFPLGVVDFIFFTIVIFLAALFRPAWVFLIFIGLLPLEIISLAPAEWGIGLRFYQWFGAILLLAVLTRILSKRASFPLFRPTIGDILLCCLPIGAFLSALTSGTSGSMRLAVIVASYYALYLLGRIFFRELRESILALPFFASGAAVAIVWGMAQNILFLSGKESFSVMPGRPNGTFPEPDWLGMFLILVIALLITLLFIERKRFLESDVAPLFTYRFLSLFGGFTVACIVLILTVSRSAWLGAAGLLFAFLFILLVSFGKKGRSSSWREALFFGNFLIATGGLALFMVLDIGLTRFDLLNRATSTASLLQKITVACDNETRLPETIDHIEDLEGFDCRHINLEAIADEQTLGHYITTVSRPDPNVEIRKDIFSISWSLIREHPITGIGWGGIGERLGTDGRGATLNASNIFLEVWLGSGLLGLGTFLWWIGLVLMQASRALIYEKTQALALFFILGLIGMLIFDLFNSGILLGFLWIFFSLAPLLHSPPYANHRH